MSNITKYLKKYQPEIIASLICLILGMLSGYGTTSADYIWYASLKKPAFNPPNWVFAPVWTVLYIMMGIAAGKIWYNWKKKADTASIVLFVLQFIFNLAWTPIFFYYHSIGWALVDICLLWLSLLALVIINRRYKVIFRLLLVYAIWVSFALGLNFTIYQLN
jgi:tryptophan-rich sensory protein